MSDPKLGNPWGRISVIAARLGVAPFDSSTGRPTIAAVGDDGKYYDIWEVVSAFLDRMDRDQS